MVVRYRYVAIVIICVCHFLMAWRATTANHAETSAFVPIREWLQQLAKTVVFAVLDHGPESHPDRCLHPSLEREVARPLHP